MIWESGPWKEELLNRLDQFNSLERPAPIGDEPDEECWNDATYQMRCEEGLFLTAFIVRKLADSGRLSFQAERHTLPCTVYPLSDLGRLPDGLNWERIDEFYDFDHGRSVTIRLRQLVNKVIHSYVLLFAVDAPEDGEADAEPARRPVTGFFVNSDTSRSKLHYVEWPNYEDALQFIASDDIVASTGVRDGRGRELFFNSRVPLDRVDWDDIERLEPGFVEKFKREASELLHGQGIRLPPPVAPE